MESPESIFLEDFGQKVDLTRRIREVLLNYPEGTTVLKELIQNADDAGATKVSFCLDRRTHATQSLLSDQLAQWQGPSLLAYNDAVFSEEDFVSISRIGGSSKHGQVWKTGRFGVGFNSVYHLTDLPSFVSGKYLVLFDPQGIYLPNVSTTNPGKRIEFINSSAMSVFKDQFSPYCAFGCDMKNAFGGTLFRFPLRNTDQASNSKLSKQSYAADDISAMFDLLHKEGVFTLLFLKNVLSIDMSIWDAGMPGPRKIYSCSICSKDEHVLWHRQALYRLSNSTDHLDFQMEEFTLEFSSEEIKGNSSHKRTHNFYIVQKMASTSSRIGSFAAAASKDFDIRLLPWASVAACISDECNDDFLKLGQAFCFLPLPVKTGLNLQINGYFEVSSNRRGIWYGADMDRSGRIRSIWNRLLLEDVVAPCFAHLMLGVQQKLGPTEAYYSLWPTGSFEEPWSILVERIYASIGDSPVMYSAVDGGRWISPNEAFLHDTLFSRSMELSKALIMLGMPVVHLPKDLYNMILSSVSVLQCKVVTPDSVRCYLRNCSSMSTIGRAYKLMLLEYCLEGILDHEVGKHALNLRLLPLANGDFGLFGEASMGISYFLCNELEYTLLQPVWDRIIDNNIPSNILNRLLSIAKASGANLFVFSLHEFLPLFGKFVPSEWKYNTEVLWNPDGNSNHPTAAWFTLFWRYLNVQCDKLSVFGDWPILPSLSGHLYRPSRQSKLLNISTLPDKMQSVLSKIGCRILNSNYCIEHPDLLQYVYSADGPGIVKSIFDVVSSHDSIEEVFDRCMEAEDKDELRHFILDPKWYIGNLMDDSDLYNCKRLPVYKVHDEITPGYSRYSDLFHPKKYLAPLECPGCLLNAEFLSSLANDEEQVLRRYYGVNRMTKAQFYQQHLFDRIGGLGSDVRDDIMLSILKELPQLCAQDASFRETLSNLEFVPISTGSLKSPAMLYDPRNEELYALLDDLDSFPSVAFQDPGVLDMLQSLGLRTAVSAETILQSARQVERTMYDNQQNAHAKGKVLLSYLEVNAMKWLPDSSKSDLGTINRIVSRATRAIASHRLKSDVDKLWSDLRLICWCPVIVSSPYPSLPWPAVSSMVAPPKLVRLYSDLWLVSASMRILDGECSSSMLSRCLGWSSPPGGSVIAAQLLELGKNNELVTDMVLRQELALAMPRIYAILSNMVGSEEMDIVKAVLEGSRCFWVGDGFATLDEVVLDSPIHLAPYIRVIPVDLASFKDLFLEFGVREFLRSTDYAHILCRMATRKGSIPLDGQEIRAATMIAQHLADVQHENQIKIFLPDTSSRLYSAAELVFNDAPWLLESENPGSLPGNATVASLQTNLNSLRFVHGNISNDVAEKLGVRSLRRMLLAESADSMNLSLSGAAEAFGQHEALTTRLKHILEMYADGPGILFELVQNAEDARASQVIFLLDKTQYGTASVLSPEMADWQGPALYCFNDSVFSPQDLYAISRIGQESKLEKPLAIGRFGLGFNCVYHFTDIPSFVSGENIVIFDPHACNLPGISPSHPGLRINFVGKRVLEQFPDQFSSFLHFGCDLKQPFPGTLFRFPLRSANAASRSQIKKEECTPGNVESLFSSFSEVVAETLLFLRNVKTISIFIREGPDTDMQLIQCVRKHHVSEPESDHSRFHEMFNFMQRIQDNQIDRDSFLNRLGKLSDGESPWKHQKIVVTEQSLSSTKSHLWLTGECIANVYTKKNNASIPKKFHKFIPWACVALYLHSVNIKEDLYRNDLNCEDSFVLSPDMLELLSNTAQDTKNLDGRAFCFLPLPINTGLPVHVNAYFELSSNRRDIWFGSDMVGGGKKRSDWNMCLLENAMAPAYGHLLEKVASEIGPCDSYFSFWPTTIQNEPWASLVRRFYQFLSDSGLRVLYTRARGGQWISTKKAIFPDFSFGKSCELADVLSDAGLPVAVMPEIVVEKFRRICPFLHFLTPQLLRTLLVQRRREFKDRNAVLLALEYCILDLTIPVRSDCFYGLPLIPLSNGSFTKLEKRGTSERIFVAQGDGYNLLKDAVPHQLLDSEIPDYLYKKICDIVRTEDFNVTFLTCMLLEKLFLRLLPSDWLYAKLVIWVPGSEGQPSLEWLRSLWSYLNSCCDDLSLFSKWPILPVGNNYLMQLTKNSNVIEDGGWSENMCSLLQRVGCLILRHDLVIEHPHLKYYVQSATAVGILNALLSVAGEAKNVESLFSGASEGEVHELRCFILQHKWFCEESMDNTHLSIIRDIPMFESYKTRKFISLNKSSKWLKPDGVLEDLVDDSFVRVDSEKDNITLKKYLGMTEPSKMEFYRDYVFPHMPAYTCEGFLPALFNDLSVMIDRDESFKEAVSILPFVLADDGSWKEPSRLYDPRVSELKLLLHRGPFFPSEKFSDPMILETLVNLGLRQSLSFTGLLDCARSISMLPTSGSFETSVSARRFLGCLDIVALQLSCNEVHSTLEESQSELECNDITHFDTERKSHFPFVIDNLLNDALDIDSFFSNFKDDMPQEEFWSDIRFISWCPVSVEPPMKGFPWLASGLNIAAPNTVRPKSQMWMTSSKMHILDGECSSRLYDLLGWNNSPDVETLAAQLFGLSRFYIEYKSEPIMEINLDVEMQLQIPLLYSRLQEFVGTEELSELKSAMHGVRWVWIGDDFVSSDSLAFDSPVKFSPYLYVVPSELCQFRDLLLALGVNLSFNVFDYLRVLQQLQNNVKTLPLSNDQLSFVQCILEAVADSDLDSLEFGISKMPLWIPDSSGVLVNAKNVVYNDAPWIENTTLSGKQLVHSCISHELASRLGIQSLRFTSLVDEDTAVDFPCMEYARICDLLELYGKSDFLLFDLLGMADCCKAKKLHLIFDKREHPRLSLLQHNLGDFQGPALLAVLDGASLSRDEVASLQFRPPWNLRGDTLNYGLGLLSCFSLSDLPSVVSDGCLYMLDPRGLALATPSNRAPVAKVFSLRGTNLTDRFHDQFSCLLFGSKMPWSESDSTIIRLPLSSEYLKDGIEYGSKRMSLLFDKFTEHASRTILFLSSVVQVSLSTWEEGSLEPCQEFSVNVNPSCAAVRNPFSEKKWKKFQLSSLFGGTNAATKLEVIDVNLQIKESIVVDRWLVVLTLGSGQTRNMALDRRYLAYNLTPVAGVAAHVSRDGHPIETCSTNYIMSPLPLSSCLTLPVTLLGYFLVRHNQGRFLFKYQQPDASDASKSDAGSLLIEAWNRELMSCVRDSYVKLVLEMQKLKREYLTSNLEPSLARAVRLTMIALGDQLYSFWPRSSKRALMVSGSDVIPEDVITADWKCLVEKVIRPFYAHLIDLPVWQLYSGNLVKAEEGMFLSVPGVSGGGGMVPETVSAFLKEHYPVFSVPWELVTEIQALGVAVREIKPKMVRDLLRASSAPTVLKSVDTYIDVLDYSLSDIQLVGSSELNSDGRSITLQSPNGQNKFTRNTANASSSGTDALEVMTTLGKALFDFGRGVVEDIGRAGPLSERSQFSGSIDFPVIGNDDPKFLSIIAEVRGLPCPSATNHIIRLGAAEVWLGDREQQMLMSPLGEKFIHPKIFDRAILSSIFLNSSVQSLLKFKKFSCRLLASNMRFLFHENWVNHVIGSNMSPWFSWENTATYDGVGGPSSSWIRLFWRTFSGSSEDISLFSDWPLIPAFLGRPVLCRVRERHLIFVPPPVPPYLVDAIEVDTATENEMPCLTSADNLATENEMPCLTNEDNLVTSYIASMKVMKEKYPWLLSLLNQCTIPVFDENFMDCAVICDCLPTAGHSLAKAVTAKLVAAKRAGYVSEFSFLAGDSDELFRLFSMDFASNNSNLESDELEVLRSLPIYKTTAGTYTRLQGQDLCMISSSTFLKPCNEQCLFYTSDSSESPILRALGVPELHDQQILVKFGLPGFEGRPQDEQEDILIYLYMNWQDLQQDSSVIEALKQTNFVKSSDEFSLCLYKAKDLFDPADALLTSLFAGVREKFPGERFISDGWLRILKTAGLRTSTEADIVLECAKRVEFLGSESIKNSGVNHVLETDNSSSQKEVSLEVWLLAESLVKAVFSNFPVLYSNNFCSLFGKIACVPAEKGFPNIGGRTDCQKVLCSYSEAIVLKDWPLAWSYSPILSKQSVLPPEYSWGPFQLRSPPPFASVLSHLQVIGKSNGEDTLAHWPAASGTKTIEEASLEVLKYLERVWDSLSSSDIAELQKVAFLPAANGTRLVMARSLFARLPLNLSPFAFELPAVYLPFVNILKDLGLQDTLSVASAKDVLLNLQNACGCQRLNPNEFRAVMEILYFLCDGSGTSATFRWSSEAVVPDDDCRLVQARSCVYVDSYGARYVNNIDTSKLIFVHTDIPERICIELGIKKLSDVVIEELEDGEHLQTLEALGSVQLADIRHKLLSASFQGAVWSICSTFAREVTAFNPNFENVKSSLGLIAEHLKFVCRLYTRFLLCPQFLDITRITTESIFPDWEGGSRHQGVYFVDQSTKRILVAEPPNCVSVLDVIGILVSRVLDSPVTLPLGCLFLCPDGSEMALLTALKLNSHIRATDLGGGINELLGKDIFSQDALQVQFLPLRPFYKGEIVAWRHHNGEKLKYGRVIEDVKPSAGHALYRFKVEVSPGVITVLLSSHVFSFRSVSISSEALAEAENKAAVASGDDRSHEHLEDLQHGRVSAAEVVQAVHEMLSAAGVDMDSSKQSLLESSLTLQEQLKESQAALLLEQEKCEMAVKEADTAKAAWLCRVCLTSEVEVTIVPCGHVLCRRCSNAVSRCPFCRLQVSKTMRIFRP